MPTSSVSGSERWARLYQDVTPMTPNSVPLLDTEEVLWDPIAVNDLLSRAFPGWMGVWYTTWSALSVSLALGPNKFGLHEFVVKQKITGRDSYMWASLSPHRTLPVASRATGAHPAYDDKVTGALMKDALKTHGRPNCPKCYSYQLENFRTIIRCKNCKTMVGGF